jgi:probable DNA repair protein
MTPDLCRLVEDGATVLTPNRRLARDLKRRFDAAQRAAGRTVWRSADILPWAGWLERSFGNATRFDAAERLLAPAQELAVWEQVIGQSSAASDLFDPSALARLARDAWATQHAWDLDLKTWGGGLPDDARNYLDWASGYAQRCASRGWLDGARLPGSLAQRLSADAALPKQPLIRYGFDQPSPQDRALLAACAAAGGAVQERQPYGERGRAVRRAFVTADDELAAAAAAARAVLLARPDARVGIVVPELSRRRADVVRILDDALEPGRVLGGRREGARPYNLSLGQPLARYPLVHAALSVLRLARGELSLHEIGVLLRSPFIGAAEQEFTRRALLDARLRRQGRMSVSLAMLQSEAHGKNHDDPYACRALSTLLAGWRPRADAARDGRRLPSAWSSAFLALLSGLGWPGERTLDSEDYQTWQRWRELVSELSQLDPVVGAIAYHDALAWLARLSAETLFQPESEDVPLQVLGVLESAGLRFDLLFVTGLHDEVLPAAARPSPLLPASLQRAQGVPHASAEWELGFAHRMMAWWASAAP